MRPLLLASILCFAAPAQTNVYLRASGPMSQVITGITNATPPVITTQAAHGFSSSCNTTSNICYCGPVGVAMGTGATPVSNVGECVYVDATHLSFYDLSGNPVVANGDWFNGNNPYPGGSSSVQWIGALTKFTIPSNPGMQGFWDGSTGDLTRKTSTGPANGLSSIVVAGGSAGSCASSQCTVTVNLSYNPLTMKIPVAAGQHFSVNGTWTGSGTNLGHCGLGGADQSAFTIASVTSSSYTSTGFTCSGLATGTYTGVHMACGPDSPPDGGVGGAGDDCARSSLTAYTGVSGSTPWTIMVANMAANNLTSASTYKTTFDGGLVTPSNGIHAAYSMAAIRFLVDPSPTPGYTAGHSLWFDEVVYSIENDFRTGGVGYVWNSQAWPLLSNGEYAYTGDESGFAVEWPVAMHAPEGQYLSSSDATNYLNRHFNDLDDPSVGACTTTNQDAGNLTNHTWELSSGLLVSGTNDSTHAQLPTGTGGTCTSGTYDPHACTANYYDGTVIFLKNNQGGNDFVHYTWGLITGQTSAGVLTVASWQGGAITPDLSEIASATYHSSGSSLSIVGTTGQSVGLSFGNNSYGLLPLTGANSVTDGAAITIVGPGTAFGSAPTSATAYPDITTAQSASGTASVTVTLGAPYMIFDTVTSNSTTRGANATITWTKTASLTGAINAGAGGVAGDGVMGYNGWGSNFDVGFYMSGVTAVGPGSSACGTLNANQVCAVNGNTPTTSSTAQMAWRFPAWTSGDCGRVVAAKRQNTRAQGVQPILYGPGATFPWLAVGSNKVIVDTGANGGGTDPNAWAQSDLAELTDDSRAGRDLNRVYAHAFDFGSIRPQMDSMTGRGKDGSSYTTDEDMPYADKLLWAVNNTLPSYPNLDGAWLQTFSTWLEFSTIPQTPDWPYLLGFAGSAGAGYGGTVITSASDTVDGLAFNSLFLREPASTQTSWLRNWVHRFNSSFDMYGYSEFPALSYLHNDPRIPDADFTAQPLQYYFDKSSSALMTADTGWPAMYRQDAAISRTCWIDTGTGCTITMFDPATYWGDGNNYDSWRMGNVALGKGGPALLGSDNNPVNQFAGSDPTVTGDTLQIGGPGGGNFLIGALGAVGTTPITSAGISNAGSFGAQYGDANSRYASACSDSSPAYNSANLGLTVNYAVRCWLHLKNPGNDEWLIVYNDAAISGGTATMNHRFHFPQNGQTQSAFGGSYSTGHTTYLGSNTIKELEDGANGHTYGLIAKVTGPPGETFTLTDLCSGLGVSPNVGQCSPTSTYSGGLGYTHAFEVSGGASTSAPVSSLTDTFCGKLMQNLTDTTFTPTELDPDGNWTGCEGVGPTSTAVALFARNGTTHAALTSFNLSASGKVDLAIVGVPAGAYTVSVAGSQVYSGTVAAGDTAIYASFSTSGGTVALTSGSTAIPSAITGKVSMSGNLVIH